MKKAIILPILLSFLAQTLFAQENKLSTFDINLELQVYPTGLLPGIRLEKGFKEKNAVSLRLGYNVVDHRDLGVKDKEEGGGFGFSFGYKRYLKTDFEKLFFGIRNDVWFNEIEWIDNIETVAEETGTADIIVVQPTVEAGYLWAFRKDWIFAPTISLGYEINVKETGGDVGEGAIFLIGVNLGKRF